MFNPLRGNHPSLEANFFNGIVLGGGESLSHNRLRWLGATDLDKLVRIGSESKENRSEAFVYASVYTKTWDGVLVW